MEKETKFMLLISVLVAVMVLINLTGSKIVPFLGLTISVSAFFYALTFPITDIISECWGKKRAQQVVWMGFVGALFAVLATQFIVALTPADFFVSQQEAFATTFQFVGRYAVGGLLAYLISQSFDVWAFHWIRRKTSNKHLWIRNNGSTMVSQLIDTAIFVTIAFYGVVPASVFLSLLFGQYVVKMAIAGIDTPIVYWLRKWIGVPEELVVAHQKSD